MPRYFFDVKDGHRLFDASGFVCEDDTDAIIRATVLAIGVSLDKPEDDPERRIAIINDAGREIGNVPVYSSLHTKIRPNEVMTYVGARNCPRSQVFVLTDFIGSVIRSATVLMDVVASKASNVWMSKPIGPGVTRANTVRVWHAGRSGRIGHDASPLVPGGSVTELSVTGSCEGDGDSGSMEPFRVPALVKIAHFREV
jgi:hypothetical protein